MTLIQIPTDVALYLNEQGYDSLDNEGNTFRSTSAVIIQLPRIGRIRWIDGRAYYAVREVKVMALEPAPHQIAQDAPRIADSPFIDINQAAQMSGLSPRTIRNLLANRDQMLMACRTPGKGYRFHRERFVHWIANRPDYSRLPGVRAKRKNTR